jgi:GeoRSP system PqqD family protein
MTPRTWTPSTHVLRNPKLVWRGFEAELAVLDPAAGSLSTLNEVAGRCWQLADGRSFSALIDQLLNEFDVERNQLEGDVRAFLNQLDQRGFLASD